jgi:hypothetical protein
MLSSVRRCLAIVTCLPAAIATCADDPDPPPTDLPPELLALIVRPDPHRPLPFGPGEVLVYHIGWGIFDVATAELSVAADSVDDQPALRVTLTTRTNGFADALYRVRNETHSWIDPQVSRTLHYMNNQDEGKRQRMVIVDFDWEAGTVRYDNRYEDRIYAPIALPEYAFDPLAITHFVRSLDFAVGREWLIPTTTGREHFISVVRVTGKEQRRFRLGRREAWVVEPDVKDVGGVFRRARNSSLRFWISADAHRYPLRMESSVSVGRFWAELVEVRTAAPEAGGR